MFNRMLIGLMIVVAYILFPLLILLQALGIRLKFVDELAEEFPNPTEERSMPLRPSGKIYLRRV